jgi:hypothetical protein
MIPINEKNLNAGHKKLFKKPQKPLFEFELSTPPNATG